MQMKNNIINKLFLLIIFSFFLFLNCKNKSNNTWEKINNYSLKPVTLTFYFPHKQIDKEIIKKLEEKAKEDINVSLNFEYYSRKPNAGIEKIIEAGIPCDVITTFSNWYPLIDQGFIQDISELFPKYAPNYFNRIPQEKIAIALT